MRRKDRLVVCLNPNERRIVDKLAEAERLPASTLARRLLLTTADERGLVAHVEPAGALAGREELRA